MAGISSLAAEDGGKRVEKIEITSKLISSCRSARMRYRLYLEQQQALEKKSAGEKRKLQLREDLLVSEEKN